MDFNKNVNTNLGITIILVFAALFTIVDFYIVCAHIDGYPFNELNEKLTNKSKSVEVISDDFSYDSMYKDRNILDSDSNIRTVKDQVFLGDGYFGFLSVDNGKLEMNIKKYNFENENVYRDNSFEAIHVSHSFDGENVKYIYYDYFQPSGDVVIWALTDSGNVYLNNFKCFYDGTAFDTKFFDNFEKKYSNVSDLRILESVYTDEFCPDSCVLKDLAIVVDGEVTKISKWGY